MRVRIGGKGGKGEGEEKKGGRMCIDSPLHCTTHQLQAISSGATYISYTLALSVHDDVNWFEAGYTAAHTKGVTLHCRCNIQV